MKKKITKSIVDAATAADKSVYIWDTELRGFGLKITPAGKKVYLLQYRMGGRGHLTRRFTIGAHGVFTPDQARKIAIELKVGYCTGI